MSDIASMRVIINDQLQYSVARAAGTGSLNEFQFPHAPVYPGSQRVYINGSLQTLTTHYTIDNDLGLVTFLTPPPLNSLVEITAKYSALSDAFLETLWAQYDDSVALKLASADALDIIASSEALITKRIKTLDLSLDGPAVAASLQAHAKTLRQQALGTDPDMQEASWDIAEMVYDSPSFVEKVIKDTMRDS